MKRAVRPEKDNAKKKSENFAMRWMPMMRNLVFAVAMVTMTSPALADGDNFDQTQAGSLPPYWTCGVTGQGSPVWTVEADPTAPSKPQVLKQSGDGDYPWCVKKDVSLKDGSVEVKFKPVSGSEDQAGGVLWRWKDGDNYYIARANALEDNVTIYHTIKGSRRQFKNVGMKVATNQWHTLRVDFEGNSFKVLFDGKVAIEANDDTFKDAGAVGVWTKADSVTEFDDFSYAGK